MQLEYNGYTFLIDEQVYEPAEDTFLLLENLSVKKTDFVLDMGTGCGILGICIANDCDKVVAVDINPHAIACAKRNAVINDVFEKMEFRTGDLFQPIKPHEMFNLIVFNAPYLPSEPGEEESWIGKAWTGGVDGRKVIDQFVSSIPEFLAPYGRVLLIQSSLSDVDTTLDVFSQMNMKAKIVAWVKVPFERICLIEAKKLVS